MYGSRQDLEHPDHAQINKPDKGKKKSPCAEKLGQTEATSPVKIG